MSVLSPRDVLARHLTVIAVLAACHLVVVCFDALGHHALLGFARLFRLGGELSFPALFSALALILTGQAAFAVARQAGLDVKERRPWLWLGFIFTFMGVDEAVTLHEHLNFLLEYGDLGERTLAPGVIPYVLLAGFLAYKYWNWWRGQSNIIQILIFCGGAVYVAGAAGVEHIEVIYKNAGYDAETVERGLLFFAEESGEMIGVALLLNAFLRRLAELGGGMVGLQIGAEAASVRADRSASAHSVTGPFGEGRTAPTVR